MSRSLSSPSVSRFSNLRLLAIAASLAAALSSLGCGSGSPTPLSSVSGSVTFDGTPVTGTITFMPAAGTGQTASAAIENGAYELGTYQKGDGVPPGEYQVAVQSWTVEPTMENPKGTSAIPEKYMNAATSGLKATVSDGGAQKIDFPLTKTGA